MASSASSVLALPKVLLLGLRKSGKSSIQKVVFEGMQPHDSVNLPTTVQPERSTIRNNNFINFEVWDFPGQSDPFHDSGGGGRNGAGGAGSYNVQQLLENCGAIVFVLDCRELIDDARARLLDTLCAAYNYNPSLPTEVFIHKVDALSEEQQSDLLASLKRRIEDEARQRLDTARPLALNYNLTSIYDHSVFQAFSAVVQNVVKNKTVYMSELLQMLNSNSNMELSYLFLSKSKLYIAVDERNRMKMHTYELCSDAIEMMLKLSDMYARGLQVRKPSSKMLHDNSTSANAQQPYANRQQKHNSERNNTTDNDNDVDSSEQSTMIVNVGRNDCIYIQKLSIAFTIVCIMQRSNLANRALIEQNIDACCDAVTKLFEA